MPTLPFTGIEEELIVAAIRYAEHKTSGELRVHIEADCKADPYERAVAVFGELKMHETAARNGVLIYIASGDKKYAIVGDSGIHEKLGDHYWQDIKDTMLASFVKGYIAAGLVQAIIDIGHQLSAHFPSLDDDKDELSNEISFS